MAVEGMCDTDKVILDIMLRQRFSANKTVRKRREKSAGKNRKIAKKDGETAGKIKSFFSSFR